MACSPVLKQQVVNRQGRERRDIVKSFRLVIGTAITLASPLSIRALALLPDVHVDKVTTKLSMLHSVLEVPESLDSPVRLLHLSFRDYLTDPENRETGESWVEEKLAHQRLAKHCLRIMVGRLRKNICGLSLPGVSRSTVDLGQLEKSMPSQLQYACMHWAYHETKSDTKPDDDKEVYDSLTTYFLNWLEAMSLLGRAKECLDLLRSLARWLENRENPRLLTFVADAVRFVQAYFSVIAEAPLQIYCCLAFAPGKSVMRRIFKNVIPKWISNLPMVEENWDACLLTLEGHSSGVLSVVFSHDSKKVASGSDDETIRIWNAETGECEELVPLDGYAYVSSFMPDGRGIVTDRGVFALSGGSQSHAGPATPRQSSVAPILACTDGTWIAAAGKDLLWLPPECRNGEVAVSGGTVVVGCLSGRVVLLEISMAEVGQWTNA